jgi:predicted NBD/HSP70 family sugar kinase
MRLGLDLSGGHARAVVVDEHGQVLARGEHVLDGGSPPAASAALRAALAGAGAAVSGAAVALSHPEEGLPADLEHAVREAVPGAGGPTLVGAGVAIVVAEQWCGAARGLANVVAFSAGEHVTSGIIVDGQVWPGAHGRAGSVGWLSLNPVEREDYRRLGGLEAEISAGGIVRRIIWRIKTGDGSTIVQQHKGDLTRITVEQVMQWARSGDGLCVSVIRDTAKYIAMAVSNLVAILDPDCVVLGGMIATSGDLLLDSIRQECARRISPAQAERLQIVLSPLGTDAAAIGAARLVRLPA